MTTNSEIDRISPHWMQLSFYAISINFNFCLIAQVLTVGVAYFSDPNWWGVLYPLIGFTLFYISSI